MKLLYIAGPYTKPDPIINVNAAIRLGMDLYERSLFLPHIPHTTMLWHLIQPRPITYWYDLDAQMLTRCDAFLRLPGESPGADEEQNLAAAAGLEWVRFNDLPEFTRSLWDNRAMMVWL
jgi:hypothetical protein